MPGRTARPAAILLCLTCWWSSRTDALVPILDRVFNPGYIRLEKWVASKQIPDAVTVPGRRRLDECTSAEPVIDHSTWDALLQEYTVGGGESEQVQVLTVDYRGMSADSRFDEYLAVLAAAPPHEELPPAEQLALMMNAYNALCIGLIVSHLRANGGLPLSINDLSSKDKGPVWDLPAGVVSGQQFSLNQIEHDELRKKWDEPAVHACIVCASASCPDLRPEAFVASKLREQMDDQLRVWMSNPTKGFSSSDLSKGVVHMSRIFLWFADDFGGLGSPSLEYAIPYVPKADSDGCKSRLKDRGLWRLRVRYFPYNWNLNDKGLLPS